MRCLRDLNLDGKRVLVRVDVNVPLGENNQVDPTEDWRIRATLPTLYELKKHRVTAVLLGHLGRPEGRRVQTLSLKPVARYLQELLGQEVLFVDPWTEPLTPLSFQKGANTLTLLENVRFHPGEEANDPGFGQYLASLGDVFVNDAFADSHRHHASIVGLTEFLPSGAGLLMEREITTLRKVHREPLRPLVVIMGGAKPETKLPLLPLYLGWADHLLVGGVLANVLLALKGMTIGLSLADEELGGLGTALTGCELTDTRLHLPVDALLSKASDGSQPVRVAAAGSVASDEFLLDIGPDTRQLFKRIIESARTIVWNGPMGLYEVPAFRTGTESLARLVAESRAFKIVGGGDSVAVLSQLGLLTSVDHVSTGGGAMLEFLAGKELAGVRALEENKF